MNRTSMIALVGALAAASVVSTICAQQATKAKPPAAVEGGKETEATCLLKINFDPQVLPLDGRSIQFLLASSGVAQEAARSVLGADSTPVKVVFEPLSMSGVSGAVSIENPLAGYCQLVRSRQATTGEASTTTNSRAATEDTANPQEASVSSADAPNAEAPKNSADPAMISGLYTVVTANHSPEPFRISSLNLGDQEQVILGRLTVTSPDAKARQVMKVITQRFEETIASTTNSERERFAVLERLLADQVTDARDRLLDLQKRRQDLLSASQLTDLSRDSILSMSRAMEKERQDISVALMAKKAREHAARDRLAQVGDESKAVAAEMEKRTLDAKAQINRLREDLDKAHSDNKESTQDIMRAQKAIEQAEAELAARSRDLAANRASQRMQEMNDQLSGLSVDMTETEMRLKVLGDSCRQMRELLSKSDEYEVQVGLELPLARSSYENARRRQEDLKIRIRAFQSPRVTVLGG